MKKILLFALFVALSPLSYSAPADIPYIFYADSPSNINKCMSKARTALSKSGYSSYNYGDTAVTGTNGELRGYIGCTMSKKNIAVIIVIGKTNRVGGDLNPILQHFNKAK